MANGFPISNLENIKEIEIKNNSLVDISSKFNSKSIGKSPFENTGIMIDGRIITGKSTPNYSGKFVTLGDVILDSVESEFYLDNIDADKWKYLKGPKSEPRKTKDGHIYKYSEGGMIFPDPLDKPSRTIITGEGGKSASRFKHVISTKKGLRRLSPIELERLNGFPDNHTKLDGITNTKRAFFMGNALVCGVIQKLGESLI